MADALDTLVASIHAHSDTGVAGDQAALLAQLRQHESLLPSSGRPALLQALAALDPKRHTLGCLFLLEALHHCADASPDAFITAAAAALRAIDPAQVKLAPELFATVCRRLRDACVACRCPCRGLGALAAAVRAVAPSRHHLTPQHVDVLQLSLLAHNYTAALQLVEEDLFEVVPAHTGVAAKDVALFCLYASMVLCAMKRFHRASELLIQALVIPTHTLNAIQLACYKKLILVSLLAEGSVPALPKYTSTAVTRNVKGAAGPYHALETAFLSRKADDLASCLASHEAGFRTDGNWGLCCQVAAALPGRLVQRLTSTYLTLPLTDLATSAGLGGPRDAEALILACVDAGQVFARIDARAGLVAFREEPEQFCTRAVASRLGAQLDAIVALAQRTRVLDEALQTEPAYVSTALQLERHAAQPGPGAALPGSQGMDLPPGLELGAPGVLRDVDME